MQRSSAMLRDQIKEQRIRQEKLRERLIRLSKFKYTEDSPSTQDSPSTSPRPTTTTTIQPSTSPPYFDDSVDAMSSLSSAYAMWNDKSVERKLHSERVKSEVNQIASQSADAASFILKDFTETKTNENEKLWEDILLRGLSLLQQIRDSDEDSAKLVYDIQTFLYFANKSRSFADVSLELKKVRQSVNGLRDAAEYYDNLKLYISNLTQFIISSERFYLA